MPRFRVGEVAIAVKPADKYDDLCVNGLEVTIVGPLRRRQFVTSDEVAWCYLVGWPGNPGWRLHAKPEWLRRKEDKIPWSDCVWQPAKVTA